MADLVLIYSLQVTTFEAIGKNATFLIYDFINIRIIFKFHGGENFLR